MWKNYFLTAWQNVIRQKLFVLINILGLSIGLSAFILIFLYVEKEFSWDAHWENADQLFWVTHNFKFSENSSFVSPYAPFPAAAMLRNNFPEAIENSARIITRGNYIQVDDNRFQSGILLADSSLLEILDLEVVSGNLQEVFAVPGRIALSEENANTFFGSENPVGNIITLEVQSYGQDFNQAPETEEVDYLVGAVFRLPEETSINLNNLGLLEEDLLSTLSEETLNWNGQLRAMNIFLLKPELDIDAMNARLPDLVNSLIPKETWRLLAPDQTMSDVHEYKFQSISEAHFDEELSLENKANRTRVMVFALIGIIVLAMGSINFIILATAKAEDRKREVGVRKVLGASKHQLVGQFLGESVLHTLVALVLALALVLLALPVFSTLIDQELSWLLLDSWLIFRLFLLAFLIGILGGVYPALVISELSLVSIFKKGGSTLISRAINTRNVLACLQFSVAIALIIATGVLYSQLNLVRNLEPGYRTQNLYSVYINPQDRSLAEPMVNELRNLAGVEEIARSSRRPGPLGMGIVTFGNYKNIETNSDVEWEGIFIDYDFMDLFEIPVVAGRSYDQDLDIVPDFNQASAEGPTPPSKIVINRQLAGSLGFSPEASAAGELINNVFINSEGQEQSRPVEIIGVVENTRFSSLREGFKNEAYLLSDINLPIISMSFSTPYRNNISSDVEAIWERVGDDSFFRTAFVEEALLSDFEQEDNEGRLLLTFSGLAIIISCMGLYGLATYTVKKGIKEVGVRKVLGAKFSSIIFLYAWRFSKPVLIANLFAWPLAIYVMLRWLQNFPEQIGYSVVLPICLLATVLTLLISWLTLAITTFKAAQADPIESLRCE